MSGSGSNTPSVTSAELKALEDDGPPDLHEAVRREKKLKARIQELVETLESMSKNNESRHTQTAEYISDLKRANGALVAAYEKAKKKHGARLRKLESQMMSLVERHDAQVRYKIVTLITQALINLFTLTKLKAQCALGNKCLVDFLL